MRVAYMQGRTVGRDRHGRQLASADCLWAGIDGSGGGGGMAYEDRQMGGRRAGTSRAGTSKTGQTWQMDGQAGGRPKSSQIARFWLVVINCAHVHVISCLLVLLLKKLQGFINSCSVLDVLQLVTATANGFRISGECVEKQPEQLPNVFKLLIYVSLEWSWSYFILQLNFQK